MVARVPAPDREAQAEAGSQEIEASEVVGVADNRRLAEAAFQVVPVERRVLWVRI